MKTTVQGETQLVVHLKILNFSNLEVKKISMVAKSAKNVFKINFHVFLKKKIFFADFFSKSYRILENFFLKIKGVFQILNLRFKILFFVRVV